MFITHNKTPYTAETLIIQDHHGTSHAVAIIKGTFAFDANGGVALAKEQLPICHADVYRGEPGRSSIRYASDLVLEKRGTDIVLNGHAYAPNGEGARKLDTALIVGTHMKRVRVFGDRFWQYRFGVVTKTNPVPFLQMPLVYERAFGGEDTASEKVKHRGHCVENPVGTGFRMMKNRKSLHGHPLPNLEGDTHRMQSWKDKPAPAGYGFIAPQWEPRASRSGTFDDEWKRRRMPLLPEDFDLGFNNAASSGLVLNQWLKGDEPVTLVNLHANHEKLRFALPGVAMTSAFILNDQTYKPAAQFDTLLIEPDENRFSMVWRARFPKPERLKELRQITIAHEE